MYEAQGTKVVFTHQCGDVLPVAACAFNGDAIRITAMLNKARYLNDTKRQYTAAARLIAEAESIPQVKWHDTEDDSDGEIGDYGVNAGSHIDPADLEV